MAPEADPFLTLGVPPGASLNEIKSAYRRLAKQYHPDTAGERALSRFLAIQAAYERLVDAEGRLRQQGGDPWRGTPGPAAGRPRASRDAWRARRSSADPGAGGAGAGSRQRPAGAAPGTPGQDGAGADSSARPRTGARGPHQDSERTRHRRPPRKATPGSTSYDEAAETGRDPAWDGGAWYGPSMGTFWTINPREYADPRKHGPEYLARARRAATDAAPTDGPAGEASPEAPPEPSTAGDAPEGGWAWSGAAHTTTGGDTADWAARSWTYDTRDPAGPTWTPGPEVRRSSTASRAAAPLAADTPPPDLETLLRRASPGSLLDRARHGGRRWRLVVAAIGWPPIALALSSLVLDLTGCSAYTASCPDEIRGPLMLGQLAVFGALVAIPVLSAIAAFATLAALAVALPVATVLATGAGPRAAVTSTILTVAFVITYLVAFAGAAWRLWRRPRGPDPAP